MLLRKVKKGTVDTIHRERNHGKVIRVLGQTGKHGSVTRDRGRKAKMPGKRISKSGKIYWETRKNRSDKALSDL